MSDARVCACAITSVWRNQVCSLVCRRGREQHFGPDAGSRKRESSERERDAKPKAWNLGKGGGEKVEREGKKNKTKPVVRQGKKARSRAGAGEKA